MNEDYENDHRDIPDRSNEDSYKVFTIQSGAKGYAVREFTSYEERMHSVTNAPKSWYFTELQQALRFIQELFTND
jgi:hypothetical protein